MERLDVYQKFYNEGLHTLTRAMPKPQQYLDVDVPENFGEWTPEAQVNFLGNAMDNTQVADYLRECAGIEPREVPQFKKHEMIQMILAIDDE